MARSKIGLIVGDLTNPYGQVVRDTLDEAIRSEGFELVAEAVPSSGGLERVADKWFEDSNFKGLVVAVASSLANDSAIDRISFEKQRRVVLIGAEHPQVDSVSADFEEGGFIATKHLVDLGHKRVAFVGAEFSDARRVSRLRGYLSALQNLGQQVRPDYVVNAGKGGTGSFATREVGREATEKLMARPNPPTAIFARNDYAALGAMEALDGLGLRVPKDVSVVGFDGLEEGLHAHPPLTSVVQPTVAQCRVAAEYLIARFQENGSRLAPRRTMMSCRLAVRSSATSAPR